MDSGLTYPKGLLKNNPNDVGAWSAYDASRIAIWKQYYDSIQSYVPGAYVILEHFADNAEEFALADAGMLLWGIIMALIVKRQWVMSIMPI